MSCNGCRVLRKGCSESCILRPCLQWIDSPDSQGHATVFVAKFFGRAGLMSFISAVPHTQRPALFQSLLFEACGRTVNPVNGAVGLLWTGNWHVCQAAVETVLRGGALTPMPELLGRGSTPDETSETCMEMWRLKDPIIPNSRFSNSRPNKRKRAMEDVKLQPADLDLCLTPTFPPVKKSIASYKPEIRRAETPSMNSEESETTTCFDSAAADDRKLLNLFVLIGDAMPRRVCCFVAENLRFTRSTGAGSVFGTILVDRSLCLVFPGNVYEIPAKFCSKTTRCTRFLSFLMLIELREM